MNRTSECIGQHLNVQLLLRNLKVSLKLLGLFMTSLYKPDSLKWNNKLNNICTCAVRACDCVRVLFMVFVPINLNLRNRANLTFSDIIIFRYHFPQIYKRGLISQYPPIKNNSTFKTFNSNTQIIKI